MNSFQFEIEFSLSISSEFVWNGVEVMEIKLPLLFFY